MMVMKTVLLMFWLNAAGIQVAHVAMLHDEPSCMRAKAALNAKAAAEYQNNTGPLRTFLCTDPLGAQETLTKKREDS